ncbi:MAG TPA: BlaI/MecI/CopY family transcriptional regulator [Thermoanaerobaculia bacterium]|jgi:BlaI family transcriptional regulator, penicillinase repressor|nr:BlaI/MecI/CopY family transcriptional regulator [Thermoanaerobaculia bacterium]
MASPSRPLADQELAIMTIVWEGGATTVREVYETLRQRRPVAYTTVMTMMNILEQKGFLEREREGRAFVYRPTRSQRRVVRQMVREFVERVFGGSARPLLVHLVEDRKLTPEDLREIARLLERKKKEEEEG